MVLRPLPFLSAGVPRDPSNWFTLIFLEGSLYLTLALAMLNPPFEGIVLLMSAYMALNKRKSVYVLRSSYGKAALNTFSSTRFKRFD